VQASYAKTNITVGLYIELKHPRFHLEQGFDSADMLLSALSRAGYQTGTGPEVPRDLGMVVPVVIQCFENQTLQYLRSKTAIPLVSSSRASSSNSSRRLFALGS
jgi:glycerophosphoryl diester phosphodiesterase